MARALTGSMQTAIVAGTIYPFFMFSVTLSTGNIYLWDGFGDLSWNSQTWLGNGWFKGFPSVPETNDSASATMDITLSGVPQALISAILTGASHASRGSLYLGLFDSSNAIIADPYVLFEGLISSPRIDDSDTDSQLTLSFVDELVSLNRPRELRYNSESQYPLFPTDEFFKYVPKLADWTGFFGSKKKKPVKKVQTTRNSHTAGRQTTNRSR